MRKTFFSIFLSAVFVLTLSACTININDFVPGVNKITGSGKVISESRAVSGFDQVDLKSIGNLTIKQGDSESLIIKADDNLMPYITANVVGSTLEIGMKPNLNPSPSKPIEYQLTVKSLSRVILSGFGNIQADELDGKNLELKLAGSGDINIGRITADSAAVQLTGFGNILINEANVSAPALELTGSGDLKINQLKADDLKLTISGFGNSTVSGTTGSQEIRLTGSGNYHGENLESNRADVVISGFGDATVWVTDSLGLTISGSGNVKYYGDPRISQTLSGLGTVKSLGEH